MSGLSEMQAKRLAATLAVQAKDGNTDVEAGLEGGLEGLEGGLEGLEGGLEGLEGGLEGLEGGLEGLEGGLEGLEAGLERGLEAGLR